MKLQLALDTLSLKDALALAEQVKDSVDIFEIGTPFVIDCGMTAVREFKAAFPDKEILSDEKIMDGGYYESQLGFEAGATYVTALGVTDTATIEECLRAAKDFNGQLVVDMLCVDDTPKKIRALEDLGVHVIAVHTGADQQALGRTPLEDLRMIKNYSTSAKVAVAGGINSTTISQYAELGPDIIIVGTGITQADDPAREAQEIKAAMNAATPSAAVV